MTLIKKHNLPFQELINGFFDNDIYGAPAFEHAVNSLPKVNLLEDDNGFNILIAAPGLSKDDFKIDLNNQVLKITVHKEKEDLANYIKKEFNYNSFTRSFNIPKIAKLDQVDASYKAGVLNIEIPKKEEAKPIPPRTINIK